MGVTLRQEPLQVPLTLLKRWRCWQIEMPDSVECDPSQPFVPFALDPRQ